MRTHYCTDVTEAKIGETVTVAGWVNSRRDHGGIIFIDLRDKSGLVQLVADPSDSKDALAIAETVRDEFVLIATGLVRARGEGLENPNLKTGKIEIVLKDLVIENRSKPMPFDINDEKVNDEIKLRNRFLELRSRKSFEIFQLRSKATIQVRNTLDELGFLDVETPILTKSTPEGARDYLVPSRVHHLRADRQPEFTQIDVEMSFCTQDDVIAVAERLIYDVFTKCGKTIPSTFRRMKYSEAMEKYGSDKPDLRIDMPLVDVIDIFANSTNEIFADIAKDKKANRIKAIKVPNGDNIFSKRQMKSFEDYVRKFGAKGLGYFQMKEDGLKGPLTKFFSDADLEEIIKVTELEVGDVVFFGAGAKKVVWDYMGRFRLFLANEMNIIPEDAYEFLWVVDFPMFEVEDGRTKALHHPFTMPNVEKYDLDNIEDLEDIESIAYDIVLNGTELGGGSIRIHKQEIQAKVFKLMGISDEEAKDKFGFLLDALSYGAPSHGGFAMGLDRMIMLLAGTDSIRDVIAFPKTQKAQCLLTQAPSSVDEEQLKELSIRLRKTVSDS